MRVAAVLVAFGAAWELEIEPAYVFADAGDSTVLLVPFGGSKELYERPVYARDAATGAAKWALAPSALGRDGPHPVVAGGLLVVGCGATRVCARDVATGAERWAAEVGAVDYDCKLAADGGRVFVVADQQLHAIDAETGDEVWAVEAVDCSMGPQARDGLVFIADGSGFRPPLRARDAATGEERWAHTVESSYVDLHLAGDTAFLIDASEKTLAALDAVSGEQRWSVPMFEGGSVMDVYRAPAVAGGHVFVGTQGAVVALDAATGEERWRAAPGFAEDLSLGDGLVFVATANPTYDPDWNQELCALDAETGEERWRVDVACDGDCLRDAAVVDGDAVFVAAHGRFSGRVLALDAKTGQERWAAPNADSLAGPLVRGGRVFLTAGTTARALDAATGEPLGPSAGSVLDAEPPAPGADNAEPPAPEADDALEPAVSGVLGGLALLALC